MVLCRQKLLKIHIGACRQYILSGAGESCHREVSPSGGILLSRATEDCVYGLAFRKLPALQELGSGEADAGWELDTGGAVCAIEARCWRNSLHSRSWASVKKPPVLQKPAG